MNKVHELRKQGYKVAVFHRRIYGKKQLFTAYEAKNLGRPPQPKGGLTTVKLRTPDNREIQAEAKCCKKDAYNRKRGLGIALSRALLFLQNDERANHLVEKGFVAGGMENSGS